MKPLNGLRLLSLAVNIPGPVAVARLVQLGARAIKVEPPAGDPLELAAPSWYTTLHEGVHVIRLNLKTAEGRSRLDDLLADSDLLITANRPAALGRLGLGWSELGTTYPALCQVAIVGYPEPDADKAGHDLTYQAGLGLIEPPSLPRIVLADLAGAEWVISAALAMLLGQAWTQSKAGQWEGLTAERYTQVALADAASAFTAPLRHGLTAPGGLLAGSQPGYNLYQAKEGWIALAVLEPHFKDRLAEELDLKFLDREALSKVFLSRPAGDWEHWASIRDLPIVALRRM